MNVRKVPLDEAKEIKIKQALLKSEEITRILCQLIITITSTIDHYFTNKNVPSVKN